MIFTIVIFIFTLLILVLIHELGHFIAAKKFGIKVLEFGFGIPPRVWGKKIGETIYSLNWLPIGGFVRLLGEDEVDKKLLEDKRSFAAQHVWKRVIVVVAGVIMNLLLAWVIFYIVLASQGFKVQIPLITPYEFLGVSQVNENIILVQEVSPSSPAEKAGIKRGDRVLAINDGFFKDSSEFISRTKALAGEEIKLTLSDPEKKNFKTVVVTPRKEPPLGEGPLGIALGQLQMASLEFESVIQKIFSAPVHSFNLTAYSLQIFGSLINRSFEEKSVEPLSHSVAGPVGITSLANTILTSSDKPLIPYLDFMAMLSLNLAILNVLPFPALDGGRLFFLLVEAITGKKVHEGFERWAHTIGMALLLLLILLITISDLRKILF